MKIWRSNGAYWLRDLCKWGVYRQGNIILGSQPSDCGDSISEQEEKDAPMVPLSCHNIMGLTCTTYLALTAFLTNMEDAADGAPVSQAVS